VFLSEQCAVSKVITNVRSSVLSALTQVHSRFALSITRCSKLAQKFAVRVCQVATVVMATTQLVLSQFKNFLSHQLRIECGPKIISKCCELVKLCHINRSGPVFLRDSVV